MSRAHHRKLAISLAVILPLFLAGCGGGGDDAPPDPCKTTTLSGNAETMKAARERAKRSLKSFRERLKAKDKKSKITDVKTTCTMPEPPPPLKEGEEPPKGPKPRPNCEVVVKVCPK